MALNILIGKLGKSTFFNTERQGFANGDEEAPNMFRMLAERHPEHTFYFCCKSDITKTRITAANKTGPNLFDDTDEDFIDPIPSNIIDLYDDWTNKDKESSADWLYNKTQRLGVKFDCGIIYQGPVGSINVAGKGTKRLDGAGEAKTLEMLSKYAGPAVHLLNMTQVPYMLLCGDPRYIPSSCRDAYNIERVVLTQTNLLGKIKRIKSYAESAESDCQYHNIHYVYSRLETIFMLTEQKINWLDLQKTNTFVIGLNGGYSRDQFIRDWLLNTNADLSKIKVYGKWSEEFTEKYPDIFEEKSIKSVEPIFLNSRYTIIPPPHDPMETFVTQKFWKMIHYGIIPFFHPKYDTLKLLNVPDILRIKSPAEMWQRIEYLDNNKDEYLKVQKALWSMLKDDYYNGNFLHEVIKTASKKYMEIEL